MVNFILKDSYLNLNTRAKKVILFFSRFYAFSVINCNLMFICQSTILIQCTDKRMIKTFLSGKKKNRYNNMSFGFRLLTMCFGLVSAAWLVFSKIKKCLLEVKLFFDTVCRSVGWSFGRSVIIS